MFNLESNRIVLSKIYVAKQRYSDHWSCVMRKPDFCLCENKGADQLCSNCEADQPVCFHYTESAISFLLKSKISRF